MSKSAVRYLLNLTDHIQAANRPYSYDRESVWRAIVERNGVVTPECLAAALNITRNHAMAVLRKAWLAGKLRREVAPDGTVISSRYRLPEAP